MKTFQQSFAVGLLTFLTTTAPAITRYVDLNSTSPTPPYTSWATAATNIQNAVDVAAFSGDVVLVTNGIYQTGSRLVAGLNRVAVGNKTLIIQSVNGPSVTVISGSWDATTNGPNAVRCVFLSGGSALSGFTLTNGATPTSLTPAGGGVYCSSTNDVVTNCVIVGNVAYSSGGGAYQGTLINCTLTGNLARPDMLGSGGGAYGSVLFNCILAGNKSGYQGGGANLCKMINCVVYGNTVPTTYYGGGTASSTLVNCTVVSNSAHLGGGSYGDTLKNCVVFYNQSTSAGSSNYAGGLFTNCCTTPLPPVGANNIIGAPMFANLAGGDLHLNAASPCINAGNNAGAPSGDDLDGNPRIAGGTVDIGAYEFQSPGSIIFYAYLQPPTNDSSGITISWQSVNGVSYFVQRSSDLGMQPTFSAIQSNIVGQAGTTSYTDTNAIGDGPFFYRVGVQE